MQSRGPGRERPGDGSTRPPSEIPAHAKIRHVEPGSRTALHEALQFERCWCSTASTSVFQTVRCGFESRVPLHRILPAVPPGEGSGLLIRTRQVRALCWQPIRSHTRGDVALSMLQEPGSSPGGIANLCSRGPEIGAGHSYKVEYAGANPAASTNTGLSFGNGVCLASSTTRVQLPAAPPIRLGS